MLIRYIYKVEFISNDIESEKIKKIDEIKTESISNLFNKILEFDEYEKLIPFYQKIKLILL